MTSPATIAQGIYQLPSSAFGTPALVNPGQEPGQLDPPTGAGLPSKGSNVLMDALAALDEALPRYLEAESFYDGDAGDLFATEKVQQLLAKSGVYEVEDFNYARVPVDALVDKLQIRAVVVSAGDDTDDEDDPGSADDSIGTSGAPPASESDKKRIAERAQEALDELRKRNQLAEEELELLLSASKHGDSYLFVWPVVEADDEDEEAFEQGVELDEGHPGRVVSCDILVNSATVARVFYDPENPLRPTHVIKRWEWLDPDLDVHRHRATLYFKDRIERWVTRPDGDPKRSEDWLPYEVAGVAWPAPNPTGRLPFFHVRTSRTYGRPEHASAYGPQRLINKLVSAHAVTIDYQSFPQRYALSNPKADDILQNMIDPDFPEDEDDDPEGRGVSPLRADPSAVWKLPGISSVGQFQPADPQVFLAPLDRYIRAMAELTGTPLDRFTGYGTPPSGESRRWANYPLNEKAKLRQQRHGAVLSAAYEFALELLGFKDVTVAIQWAPVDVASGTEDWGIVAAKITNGVPVKQALVEAGYPEDDVDSWLNDETGADLMRRVALLNQIGTAVQTLGAGVGLGVVSAPQVGDIIARILGATAEELPDLDRPVELHPAQQQMLAQVQQQQRNAQLSEHDRQNPSPVGPDKEGNVYEAPKPADLPPPPPPVPPVRVGA